MHDAIQTACAHARGIIGTFELLQLEMVGRGIPVVVMGPRHDRGDGEPARTVEHPDQSLARYVAALIWHSRKLRQILCQRDLADALASPTGQEPRIGLRPYRGIPEALCAVAERLLYGLAHRPAPPTEPPFGFVSLDARPDLWEPSAADRRTAKTLKAHHERAASRRPWLREHFAAATGIALDDRAIWSELRCRLDNAERDARGRSRNAGDALDTERADELWREAESAARELWQALHRLGRKATLADIVMEAAGASGATVSARHKRAMEWLAKHRVVEHTGNRNEGWRLLLVPPSDSAAS